MVNNCKLLGFRNDDFVLVTFESLIWSNIGKSLIRFRYLHECVFCCRYLHECLFRWQVTTLSRAETFLQAHQDLLTTCKFKTLQWLILANSLLVAVGVWVRECLGAAHMSTHGTRVLACCLLSPTQSSSSRKGGATVRRRARARSARASRTPRRRSCFRRCRTSPADTTR